MPVEHCQPTPIFKGGYLLLAIVYHGSTQSGMLCTKKAKKRREKVTKEVEEM